MPYTPDGYLRVRYPDGKYGDIPKAKLPMKTIEHIHILGAGSLGLFWAAKIKSYVMRYPITMIMRKQLLQPQQPQSSSSKITTATTTQPFVIPDKGCVTVRLIDHFEPFPYPPAVYMPYETATKKIRDPIQNLVIATKAYDAIPAVREVYHRFTRNTKVLILSNGSHGIAEELSQMLFKFRIHRVIVADHRVETKQVDLDDLLYRIEHVRNGKFYLHDYIEMATIFDEGSLNWCKYDDDNENDNYDTDEEETEATVAEEGSFNRDEHVDENGGGINAFHVGDEGDGDNCDGDDNNDGEVIDNGDVDSSCNHQSDTSDEKVKKKRRKLDFEKVAWYRLALQCVIDPVTAIHGIRNGELRRLSNFESEYKIPILTEMATLYASQYPLDVHGNKNNIDTMVSEMKELVDTTIRNTRDFQSDMLRDVLRGQPTEIDYLSGYVRKVAQRHNLAAPVNESLWNQVKALQGRQVGNGAPEISSSSSSVRRPRNPFVSSRKIF
jgi:ketopantoate reductase